ncbi:hypothetical protein HYZ76_01415 [Candidatus Falkowbacteria bacterium]|nr:hypothetical protein [Candidatus Falkowbacteria bacterium]
MTKIKLTALSLLILPLLGGCFLAPQDQNANTNVILNPDQSRDEESGEIDTSEWKTYRNEEYGFEFKYPEEWIKKDGWIIDSNFIFIGGVQIPIKDHFDTGVWVFALKDYNFSECKDFFSGYDACITEKLNDDYSKTITFEYKNHILRINTYYGKFDEPELKGVFDRILLTFQFSN